MYKALWFIYPLIYTGLLLTLNVFLSFSQYVVSISTYDQSGLRVGTNLTNGSVILLVLCLNELCQEVRLLDDGQKFSLLCKYAHDVIMIFNPVMYKKRSSLHLKGPPIDISYITMNQITLQHEKADSAENLIHTGVFSYSV